MSAKYVKLEVHYVCFTNENINILKKMHLCNWCTLNLHLHHHFVEGHHSAPHLMVLMDSEIKIEEH